MLSPLINFGEADTVVSFVSSMAIILGAVFVVFELRDNERLLAAANEQAKAAAAQAKLTADQMKQTNEIADMDMIVRLYEFANTKEFQTSWLTVINTNLKSYEEFQRMPAQDQVSFFQVAALFESIGVLADRGIVSIPTVDDMFQTEIAWNAMKPFLDWISERYKGEGYVFFERLKESIEKLHQTTANESGADSPRRTPTP
jgi:hypothetical protein